MHQSISAAPPHPPGLLPGICPPCQSREWGISIFCAARGAGICQPRGQTRAFNPRAVPQQHITTERILVEKQADRLICQGRGKIEEVCKGMFSILCMHLFTAYQARITQRNSRASYRRVSTFFWLLNQVSLDIIRRTSFHIYKTIHNSKLYSAL